MSSFSKKMLSSKIIGWILIMTAVFGWLVSLAGAVALWAVKPVVSNTATALVSTGLDTLNATSNMLQVIESYAGRCREEPGSRQRDHRAGSQCCGFNHAPAEQPVRAGG